MVLVDRTQACDELYLFNCTIAEAGWRTLHNNVRGPVCLCSCLCEYNDIQATNYDNIFLD